MSKVVKEKQAKRRSEIIESVIPLIASEDFDRISVSDIGKAAGISIGSFYHYLTQKTDILVGLMLIIDEELE
jgi:AcrR family transcriptional regulator